MKKVHIMKELPTIYNKYGTKTSILFGMLITVLLLAGCSNKNDNLNETVLEDGEVAIYYLDKNETKIVSESYTPIGSTKEELVLEFLNMMNQEPINSSYKKAKPDSVTIENYKFNEDKRFSIYFNQDYYNLNGITEALYRAILVKTLCQIEGIDYIEFYVGGQPMMGTNGKTVERMEPSDFIDTTGLEDVYLTLYFSNESGTALVDSYLWFTYDGNMSIERLIIEQLIKGPIEEHMIGTLPKGTELIKVTTNDGICYVDMNDKFLEKVPGVKDDVIIYSIVNSLVELSTINKVQFSINGSTGRSFREGISFESFFERNLDIVEVSR